MYNFVKMIWLSRKLCIRIMIIRSQIIAYYNNFTSFVSVQEKKWSLEISETFVPRFNFQLAWIYSWIISPFFLLIYSSSAKSCSQKRANHITLESAKKDHERKKVSWIWLMSNGENVSFLREHSSKCLVRAGKFRVKTIYE